MTDLQYLLYSWCYLGTNRVNHLVVEWLQEIFLAAGNGAFEGRFARMRAPVCFVLPSKEYVVVEYSHCQIRFIFGKMNFVGENYSTDVNNLW